MSEAQPFTCPKCHKLVINDDKNISEHYGSPNHDKGLYVAPQQQYPPQLPFPQAPQPPAQYGPPQPGLPSQQWPAGNAPQLPATRYLGWWDQVKGIWHYYRKGMAWIMLLTMLATIALLTRI